MREFKSSTTAYQLFRRFLRFFFLPPVVLSLSAGVSVESVAAVSSAAGGVVSPVVGVIVDGVVPGVGTEAAAPSDPYIGDVGGNSGL